MSTSEKAPVIPENAIEVPHTALDPETLRHLAQEFVTRDGTDYGSVEKSLEEKVAGLLRQLDTGKARIYYESRSETINIVVTQELSRSEGKVPSSDGDVP